MCIRDRPTTFGGLPGGTVYYVGDQSNPQHTTLRPIQEGKAPNYNVTWETAKKYNLGIDAKFFDDRLSFVFDIYKEMRSDILTDMVTYPSFVFPDFQTNAQANGYHTLYLTNKENYAKVRNQGFEVELGWDGTIGKNFSYFVKGSYSYTINKTLQLSESSKDYPYQYATGHMLDEISGLICEGIYDSYEEINDPNLSLIHIFQIRNLRHISDTAVAAALDLFRVNDFPRVWNRLENRLDQRGLTAAVRSDNPEKVLLMNIQIDVAQRLARPVSYRYVIEFDQFGHGLSNGL